MIEFNKNLFLVLKLKIFYSRQDLAVLRHILTNLNSTSVPLKLREEQESIDYYLLTIILAELCLFFAVCTIIFCSYFVSVQIRTHYQRTGLIEENHSDVERKLCSCCPLSSFSSQDSASPQETYPKNCCSVVRLDCCAESEIETDSCSSSTDTVSYADRIGCKKNCDVTTCSNCCGSLEKIECIPLEVLESSQNDASPTPSEISDVVYFENKTKCFDRDVKVHFKKCKKTSPKACLNPVCNTTEAIVHTENYPTSESQKRESSFPISESQKRKSSLSRLKKNDPPLSPVNSPSYLKLKKGDRKNSQSCSASESEILELDRLEPQSIHFEFQDKSKVMETSL